MNVKWKSLLLFTALMAASPAYAGAPDVFTATKAITSISEAMIKAGVGSDGITLHITSLHDDDIVASAQDTITPEVSNLEIDKEHNRWKATLLFTSSSQNLAPVALLGSYEELKKIPMLTQAVHAGETITAEEITYEKQPINRTHTNIIMDANALIGKYAKHNLLQGRAIRQDEIVNQAILMRGARVTMIYKSTNLEIRTSGEALDNGAKGDVVRVRNLTSKAVIDAVVTSGDTVRVSSSENTAAEAM